MCERNPKKFQVSAPNLPSRSDRQTLFGLVIKQMDEQRIREREKVRRELKAAGVPVPAEIIVKLAQLRPADVRDVLLDHVGFETWDRYESYKSSLRVFERAVSDLIQAIGDFEVAAQSDILSRHQSDKLDNTERAIQKELFAAANAAHSLVDHSRRLQQLVCLPSYATKLNESFGDDGLHEFVICIRTLLHHLRIIRTGWRLETRFDSSSTKASFTLNLDQVRFAVERSSFSSIALARIRAYIDCLSPGPIDLKPVFQEYHRRASVFHGWYGEELASPKLIALRDCEHCLLENKKFGARTWWRAMLGNWLNWKNPPNPYDHLSRFLAVEELEEIYRLPMQSEEQVDKVIEYFDRDRACDAGLRKMAYQLFSRANPPAHREFKV